MNQLFSIPQIQHISKPSNKLSFLELTQYFSALESLNIALSNLEIKPNSDLLITNLNTRKYEEKKFFILRINAKSWSYIEYKSTNKEVTELNLSTFEFRKNNTLVKEDLLPYLIKVIKEAGKLVEQNFAFVFEGNLT